MILLAATPARSLDLPEGAEPVASITREDADLLVATGPLAAGRVPGQVLTGRLQQDSFRLPASLETTAAQSTAALIDGLSADIVAGGQRAVYACAARACGGFDFRFALDILPEPQMHVDLGDYRYASFLGPAGTATVLIVSRSEAAIYVQVSTLTPAIAAPQPDIAAPAPAPTPAPPEAQAFAAALEGQGALVLQDVAFAVGADALTDPDAPSLQLIADYLAANPERSLAIVGHTDASGTLAANIDLSRARARAVRAAVIALGGDGARITADGVGFLAPRASNLTEAGRQQNRRVEVMLTSTR